MDNLGYFFDCVLFDKYLVFRRPLKYDENKYKDLEKYKKKRSKNIIPSKYNYYKKIGGDRPEKRELDKWILDEFIKIFPIYSWSGNKFELKYIYGNADIEIKIYSKLLKTKRTKLHI